MMSLYEGNHALFNICCARAAYRLREYTKLTGDVDGGCFMIFDPLSPDPGHPAYSEWIGVVDSAKGRSKYIIAQSLGSILIRFRLVLTSRIEHLTQYVSNLSKDYTEIDKSGGRAIRVINRAEENLAPSSNAEINLVFSLSLNSSELAEAVLLRAANDMAIMDEKILEVIAKTNSLFEKTIQTG